MQALCFLRKCCEAFLALVLDSKRGQVNLENIPMIKEFPTVFPEELLGFSTRERSRSGYQNSTWDSSYF